MNEVLECMKKRKESLEQQLAEFNHKEFTDRRDALVSMSDMMIIAARIEELSTMIYQVDLLLIKGELKSAEQQPKRNSLH